MGLKMLKDQSGKDKLFNLKEVEDALYSNRAYLWENLGEELKARCATWSEPQLKEACDSLSLWDGLYNLDSKGFAAFREFATLWDNKLHKVAFNVADPLNTPSGLADEAAPVDGIKAIFLKVADNLAKAGFSPSASVREIQFFKLPDFEGGVKEKISYHGGLHEEGAFNVQDWDGNNHLTNYAYPEVKDADFINAKSTLTKEGYGINGGSSFMMLAEFTAKGPKVRGILSYSQSSDPDSPYFADQNYLYQQKKMRDFPHAWRDIEWGNYNRQTIVLK
jgi:acyl-homoserine-lactone acylase